MFNHEDLNLTKGWTAPPNRKLPAECRCKVEQWMKTTVSKKHIRSKLRNQRDVLKSTRKIGGGRKENLREY